MTPNFSHHVINDTKLLTSCQWHPTYHIISMTSLPFVNDKTPTKHVIVHCCAQIVGSNNGSFCKETLWRGEEKGLLPSEWIVTVAGEVYWFDNSCVVRMWDCNDYGSLLRMTVSNIVTDSPQHDTEIWPSSWWMMFYGVLLRGRRTRFFD